MPQPTDFTRADTPSTVALGLGRAAALVGAIPFAGAILCTGRCTGRLPVSVPGFGA
jgi:hypothetical protein